MIDANDIPAGAGWLALILPVIAGIAGFAWKKFRKNAATDGIDNWKDDAVELGDAVMDEIQDDESEPPPKVPDPNSTGPKP